MPQFVCWEQGGDELLIAAGSARLAARYYVDGGDWSANRCTSWVRIHVQEEGSDSSEHIKVAIEPDEPDCLFGEVHDWRSPQSVVGGIEENPGVQCHGGGVVITEVCARCGIYREIDTWAQDPETGEQGLRSTEYRDADEVSLAFATGDA